jgi:DNA-binding transcriptional MerR regulator
MRIGELAERTGLTTRTIRYYEERGLLAHASTREKGEHRLYADADVVRLQELVRLRDLLGLSLEELVELAEAEEARAALRGQWAESTSDEQRARIVEAAISLVERQLGLVRTRQEKLASFADELHEKLASLKRRRSALRRGARAAGPSRA